MHFPVHTPQTAPEASRPLLEQTARQLGFVPNLTGELAASPAALEGYLALSAAFAHTSLTSLEREIVLVAVSVEDRCHYCTAAHTTSAEWQKLDLDAIDAVRNGRPIAEPRLEALRVFTVKTVRARGWLGDADLRAFMAAGYGQAVILEVLMGVGLKTFSNYANHVTETPLDEAFQHNAFTPAARRAA